MDEPRDSGAVSEGDSQPLTGALEELSEPLGESEEAKSSVASRWNNACSGRRRTCYRRSTGKRRVSTEALRSKAGDEETLWVWERVGESASLLMNEGSVLREVRLPDVSASPGTF